MQLAAELQIVGRVGEDQVDGAGRQALHEVDAVADENAIQIVPARLSPSIGGR